MAQANAQQKSSAPRPLAHRSHRALWRAAGDHQGPQGQGVRGEGGEDVAACSGWEGGGGGGVVKMRLLFWIIWRRKGALLSLLIFTYAQANSVNVVTPFIDAVCAIWIGTMVDVLLCSNLPWVDDLIYNVYDFMTFKDIMHPTAYSDAEKYLHERRAWYVNDINNRQINSQIDVLIVSLLIKFNMTLCLSLSVVFLSLRHAANSKDPLSFIYHMVFIGMALDLGRHLKTTQGPFFQRIVSFVLFTDIINMVRRRI